MLSVVSASSEYGPTLFIFQRKTLPYLIACRVRERVVETYANYLPRNSAAIMRQEVYGIDAVNFMNWARLFVEHVRDLTYGGRKILLIYNGCRSHMSLAVLEYLRSNEVEVYALPAHTSEFTQTCDSLLFSKFKGKLNRSLRVAAAGHKLNRYSCFDYCSMLREAHHHATTRSNIIASFEKCSCLAFES